MPSGSRRKREKGAKQLKKEEQQPLAPETLDDQLNPFKRLFPFDFPGQTGDWPKKRVK